MPQRDTTHGPAVFLALLAPLPVAPFASCASAGAQRGPVRLEPLAPDEGGGHGPDLHTVAISARVAPLRREASAGAAHGMAQTLAMLAAAGLVARRRLAWFRARHASAPARAATMMMRAAVPDAPRASGPAH